VSDEQAAEWAEVLQIVVARRCEIANEAPAQFSKSGANAEKLVAAHLDGSGLVAQTV